MNINLDTAKDTLCKNILIYGYCKYENKGCVFSHNTKAAAGAVGAGGSQGAANGNSGGFDAKRKFNFNTPSFQPSVQNVTNKFAALSPRVNDIPVFVPGGSAPPSTGSSGVANSSGLSAPTSRGADSADQTDAPAKKFNVSTPIFMPSNIYGSEFPAGSETNNSIAPPTSNGGSNNPYFPGNSMVPGGTMTPGASEVFYQQQAATYPLQYHLYAPAPPPRLTFPLPPHETNANLMFIPNDLRESLQKKNEATLQTIPRSNLPDHVNTYHSLVPIDKTYEPNSEVWGIPTSLYKVFSNVDGNAYAIRKIDLTFPIINELPFRTIRKWKTVKNSNVVQVQEAFTTMAFGASKLIIAYDYYPNSNTLVEHHRRIGTRTEPITEDIMWNYTIQLVNALVAIHEKGLAARSSLSLSKIIVTNKNRVRLSSCGISDIIDFEKDEEEIGRLGGQGFINKLQREDVHRLGRVLMELSAMTISPNLRNTDKLSLLGLLRTASTLNFSSEYIEMLTKLNEDSEHFDLVQFRQIYLSSRAFKLLNELQNSNDYIESQLGSELENARLFRLMAKLNFIIDRPQAKDWNENGNKYVLKLFRDYVFFQYDEFGKPITDLSRVLVSLNKLDAGIDEKILLVSRDEKSCIMVSYKEVRDMVDSIFRTLTRDR
ncbi:component of Pab1p-stimulated poly(A) ribonuclease [Suhomyces tanzawaensis NRRL Y-17324]|uniref:PAN2-PAN3 deadenylation complex subunit PAN3 n=1 Tax=Suhomyces tanzawaensis NRRL Y-17324 TaxID=984487 RepID=A0A1E4SLZ3_9ASCO|nr:component of Pab1p-stimulated poly(A) ribonuclease [Suhomyces tanzawaensis NRRL Y-17324]ODV80546.1 component of Pab1p-stimulated poly(A) ribonuclease [Suhomyces tanzawaensis NRRL Y-17324]